MIRICYVTDAPFLGGAEWYVSRLAGALDRGRFSPCVLMKAGHDPHLAAWAENLSRTGVPVRALPMGLPFAPRDALHLWRVLDEVSPHIVHLNLPGPYDGQMGLVLPIAKAAGARTVVTEHLPMVERLWKRALVKRTAYRFLDAAVTMTAANARYLVERQGVAPERVHVVANGVRRAFGTTAGEHVARRPSLGIPAPAIVVMYLGNILEHKGLRRLIEAVSRTAHGPVLHLVVVGGGADEDACRALAAERGLAGQVSFLGRRDAADIEALLAAADVLALPSSIEGLPYVLLEAMASRLPVVAGRVYGIPEVVEDGVTGLLVDPHRIDEIAAALDRLAADPALRARMGHAARARFEAHFTLEEQARRMRALYESVLEGAPRSRGAAS